MGKPTPPNTASTAKKPNQMPAGTGSAGDPNQEYDPIDANTVAQPPTAPSQGPEVAGGVADKVESHEIRPGVTEVESDIDPHVPAPPAPTPALGIDPAHVSLDAYPSEEAASLAPGVHVDLTQTVKPVGVFTPQPPPFHRVDGAQTGETDKVKATEGSGTEDKK